MKNFDNANKDKNVFINVLYQSYLIKNWYFINLIVDILYAQYICKIEEKFKK